MGLIRPDPAGMRHRANRIAAATESWPTARSRLDLWVAVSVLFSCATAFKQCPRWFSRRLCTAQEQWHTPKTTWTLNYDGTHAARVPVGAVRARLFRPSPATLKLTLTHLWISVACVDHENHWRNMAISATGAASNTPDTTHAGPRQSCALQHARIVLRRAGSASTLTRG